MADTKCTHTHTHTHTHALYININFSGANWGAVATPTPHEDEKMSHTWVSSSSSTKAQAQRSSSRRRVHHTSERPVNHQTPDTEREVQHKRGQNAWDLSEEERYGNGHRQTVDRGDEREEIADSYRSGQTSSSGERPLQR